MSVQGIIRHTIGPVNANPGIVPLCLQVYFTEGEDENPYNESPTDRQLLTMIRHSINEINPLIINLKQHIQQMLTYNDIPRYRIVLGEKGPIGANQQLYLLPTTRELSAVIIDPDINVDMESIRKKREIIIQSHGGALQNIPSDSPLYDPLSYTILFPNGDLGWTYTLTQNDKKITLLRYYCNRLHFRDKYGPIYYDSVSHAGLLSHQYIIDSWIKTEESRLNWLFHNQEHLRAEVYQGK